MSDRSMPLAQVPADIASQLEGLGAPPSTAGVSLYRAIANNPDVLAGWIELSWRLRKGDAASTRLRELVIVRSATLSCCEYELVAHRRIALSSGVSSEELDALEDWRASSHFSPAERSALALCEAMFAGQVPDQVLEDLERHFDPPGRVQLIVTCGFYNMVPRVVDALRLPFADDASLVERSATGGAPSPTVQSSERGNE